jgi:uncharacterized protein (TIGR02147 family)
MHKPHIFEYSDMILYCQDNFKWQKTQNVLFSLRNSCTNLSRCSPTLLSLVLQRKRKLTGDRVSDFSKLLKLNAREEKYFASCINGNRKVTNVPVCKPKDYSRGNTTNTGLLSSWVNLYVKDSCRLLHFSPNAAKISQLLNGFVSQKQAEKALEFLLRSGFLRRTLAGRIVENNVVDETTDEIPSSQIRSVHKKALQIAAQLLDSVPTSRREASTVLLPLNERSFQELKKKLKEWAEDVAEFAEEHAEDNEVLYQFTLNLSPVSVNQKQHNNERGSV